MKGYLLCIIGTVLLSSIITVILPEGKTAKTVKGIAKLVCLLAIVAPIPSFLQSWKKGKINSEKNLAESVISTDESFIKYYCEMRVQNVELQLEEEIQEKFNISVDTEIVWNYEDDVVDSDGIHVQKICVRLEEDTPLEGRNAVYEHLTKNYCSEVLIE